MSSEYSNTESSDDAGKQEIGQLSDEDEFHFYDTRLSFSESAASPDSKMRCSNYGNEAYKSGDLLAVDKSKEYLLPSSKRRSKLPEPVEKEKGVSLWSMITDNVGKDLTRVCFLDYFNEPLSSLQKCFECECGLRGNGLRRILYVAAYECGFSGSDGNIELATDNEAMWVLFINRSKAIHGHTSYMPTWYNYVPVTCLSAKNSFVYAVPVARLFGQVSYTVESVAPSCGYLGIIPVGGWRKTFSDYDVGAQLRLTPWPSLLWLLQDGSSSAYTAQVLKAADKLEKDLVNIVVEDSVDSDDGGKSLIREMPPYEAENTIANLVKAWVKE